MPTPYNPGGPVDQLSGRGGDSPGDQYFRYGVGLRTSSSQQYPQFRTGVAPDLFQPNWTGGGQGFDAYYDTGSRHDVYGNTGGVTIYGGSSPALPNDIAGNPPLEGATSSEDNLLQSILDRSGAGSGWQQSAQGESWLNNASGLSPWQQNASPWQNNASHTPDTAYPTSNATGTAPPGFPNRTPLGAGGRGGIYGASNFGFNSTGGNFGFSPGGGGQISSYLAGQYGANHDAGSTGFGFGGAGLYEVSSHPGYAAAEGMRVPGDPADGDSVPITATPGEVVVDAETVAQKDAVEGPGWEKRAGNVPQSNSLLNGQNGSTLTNGEQALSMRGTASEVGSILSQVSQSTNEALAQIASIDSPAAQENELSKLRARLSQSGKAGSADMQALSQYGNGDASRGLQQALRGRMALSSVSSQSAQGTSDQIIPFDPVADLKDSQPNIIPFDPVADLAGAGETAKAVAEAPVIKKNESALIPADIIAADEARAAATQGVYEKGGKPPLINLPHVTGSPNDSQRVKAEHAITNTLRDFVTGATTPEGMAGLLVPPYGLAQMIASAPEAWAEVKKAEQTPAGSQERWDAGIKMISLIGGIAGGAHAIKGGIDAVQIRSAAPEVPRAAQGGENIPQDSGGVRPSEQGAQVTGEAQVTRTETAQVNEPIQGSATETQGTVGGQPQTGEVLGTGDGTPAPATVQSNVQEPSGTPASEATPNEPIGTQAAIAKLNAELGPETIPGTDTPRPTIPVEPKGTSFPSPESADEPHVSAIANRFVAERAAQGEIGEVAPGKGFSTRELAERGLRMPPEEINQHVSDLMQGTGDPIKQGMAVRAEEARLSARSNELSRAAEGGNLDATVAADNAFKDLTDFHNGPVAKLKENWANQGRLMQGEIPVDLSTLNGLREQWLRDTGESPPPRMDETFRRTAKSVEEAIQADSGARQVLGEEITKGRRKLPTADEVRDNIRKRMGLEPCRV